MVGRFANVILKAEKKPALRYRLPVINDQTMFKLAPWCYISEQRGIYHDFRAVYHKDDALVRLAYDYPDGFPGAAIDVALLRAWLDDGYVVPVIEA